MAFLKELAVSWKSLVIIATPLLALPILFIDGSKEMSAMYGLVIMAIYWITEAIPLAVTALCPAVIFPLLSVVSSQSVAQNYIKNAGLFGFFCLTISISVEKWNLHRRIALRTLLLMGSSPKWLMLGFMIPTWFLSLWVNNTSATAMMLPIVSAVLSNLGSIQSANEKASHLLRDDNKTLSAGDGKEDAPKKSHFKGEEKMNVTVASGSDNQQSESEREKTLNHLCKALNISVCYAATTGGIGSLTGTGTNVIMQGHADEFFRIYGLDSGVNFLSWMSCCIPVSLLCLMVTWVWLVIFFFGFRELFKWEWSDKKSRDSTRNVIRGFLDGMGPMTFAEKAVLGHFSICIVLWLTMKIPGGGGWVLLFKHGYVKSAVPSLLLLTSMFIFPSVRPGSYKGKGAAPPLLEWNDVQTRYPWGTLLLMGGGFALAFTIKEAGLSALISTHLASLSGSQPWLINLMLTMAISFLTEVTSNATTASILCPILAQLAISLGVHPLYFMFPGALACSLAFMLPVATPPNTLVFATGYLQVKDMIKIGFFLNIVCVLIVNMAANTWMTLYLGLDTVPPEMLTTTTINHTTASSLHTHQMASDIISSLNSTAVTLPSIL